MNPLYATHHLGQLEILEVLVVPGSQLAHRPHMAPGIVRSIEMLVETRNDGVIGWLNNGRDETIINVVSAARMVRIRLSSSTRVREPLDVYLLSLILQPSVAANRQGFMLILGHRHNTVSNA
jgi:hypothetical protein